ncbi:hypothetical protein BACCOP_02294 [Phocaeicola coprocola DSM 17136]|uniref:Uncharacterized protein n=1 Tax=Phocaeicola coprocola DSM 17136 TaxID=470145 RepID=B3JK71_9BACT|nr:hypothetical protein BACCOP_02294 [Phocaeicola coprocola DSM 17136]
MRLIRVPGLSLILSSWCLLIDLLVVLSISYICKETINFEENKGFAYLCC